MFQRYALIFGRGAHRHKLSVRAQRVGMALLAQTSEMMLVGRKDTQFMMGDRAIIVGQIFSNRHERLGAIPPELESVDARSDLEDALTRFWGNYALFLSTGNEHLVYREPSASVPVYRCLLDGESVFVSDAEFAMQLGLLEGAEIDRHFVTHWLQFPFLRTRRTGIRGVAEILPGMITSRQRGKRWSEVSAWRPSSFTGQQGAIHSAPEAQLKFRETALKVIPAQIKPRGALLRLSGGLDSSIIAASLAAANAKVPCINFATRSRDGDERSYAQDVAKAMHLPLTELVESKEPAALTPVQTASFLPLINPLLEPFERMLGNASQQLEASLLLDGAGGDNLFFAMSSAAPLLDAIRSWQFRIARETIGNIATRANATIWEVLAAASRRALRRHKPWKEDRTFLRASALLPSPELHPWLDGTFALPGKREHVEALVHIHHFLDRSPTSLNRLHPLLAQPMLELCLRIPSWLWVRGGRDRAIAREAFEGLVPRSVLDRRLKGSLQSLLNRAFTELRDDIRILLMEGELARSGIIETELISQTLLGEEWTKDAVQLRLSEMAALELWLRFWSGLLSRRPNAF